MLMHLNVKLKPHDVQVIVSNPMRTSSNVHTAIVAPQYTNLKLYNDSYVVTISLGISRQIYELLLGRGLNAKPIEYRGRFYLHYETCYQYSTSFAEAYEDAAWILRQMKIVIREAKLQLLQEEIECI